MSKDMQAILGMTLLVSVLGGVLGAALLHLARRRSLVLSIVAAALVPVATVSVGVALNVRAMVISAHDSTVVMAALGGASVLALGLSIWLGRMVAAATRDLSAAVRELGGPVGQVTPGRPVPGEIGQVAAELDATRERLRSSRAREQALERSRRELVAFMSHDLRTPLAGLRALAEGLEDGVVEDVPGALRQMRSTVDRMNGLVGDLFELSRLSAGAQSPVPARRMVSMVELAHDVVAESRQAALSGSVDLVVDTADDGDRLAVLGNSDELSRALTNLVGNAVRHTPAGGRVAVSARRAPDGRARVTVTDGCGGIAADVLDRVFDVGWRAEPERGREAGAGLGLAIAKGVVESHDGEIRVANVSGGCRFAIALPPAGGVSVEAESLQPVG